LAAICAAILIATACTDVLNVPPPASIQTAAALKNKSGAEATFASAKSQYFGGMASQRYLLDVIGRFSDELTEVDASVTLGGSMPNIDARRTVFAAGGQNEYGDGALQPLLGARSSLLLAVQGLQQYEGADGQQKAGEAYALVGYIEVQLAEDYCAGITLDRALPDGGWAFVMPISTDSLLATAETHFDSAIAHANNDATVLALAHTGLARTRLDRGHFADAATAASSVPTSFVYNIETPPAQTGSSAPNYLRFSTQNQYSFTWTNVSDREGGNGLNYRSANDPRLVFDTTVSRTGDRRFEGTGLPWYYPVKFGNPSTFIPLSTGVEARLIEAEAAWQSHDITAWTNDLNTLRAQAPSTYLQLSDSMPHLTADSTTGASDAMQVSVMFRERAFWLFGLGTRLGDMRRLVRQYGRDQSTVYPVGSFGSGAFTGLSTYGTDVVLTLPTPPSGYRVSNPNYKGCLVPTTTA